MTIQSVDKEFRVDGKGRKLYYDVVTGTIGGNEYHADAIALAFHGGSISTIQAKVGEKIDVMFASTLTDRKQLQGLNISIVSAELADSINWFSTPSFSYFGTGCGSSQQLYGYLTQ